MPFLNKSRVLRRALGFPGMNDLSAEGGAGRQLMELDIQLWGEAGGQTGSWS